MSHDPKVRKKSFVSVPAMVSVKREAESVTKINSTKCYHMYDAKKKKRM